MKVLEKDPARCTKCGACESECSKTWFKEDNREKSCIRITPEAMIACTQCGECIKICPVEAISKDRDGVVRIKKSICVGCFMCAGFCPESALFMHNDYIEPFKCVACGQCVKKCPAGAISIAGVG
jgi:ferredoxin